MVDTLLKFGRKNADGDYEIDIYFKHHILDSQDTEFVDENEDTDVVEMYNVDDVVEMYNVDDVVGDVGVDKSNQGVDAAVDADVDKSDQGDGHADATMSGVVDAAVRGVPGAGAGVCYGQPDAGVSGVPGAAARVCDGQPDAAVAGVNYEVVGDARNAAQMSPVFENFEVGSCNSIMTNADREGKKGGTKKIEL